jgi:hypothetical protein
VQHQLSGKAISKTAAGMDSGSRKFLLFIKKMNDLLFYQAGVVSSDFNSSAPVPSAAGSFPGG